MRQFDSMAFRKTKDVTKCRCFGGTPHGRFNIYGQIMTNHKDYSHLDIQKFRLHRSSHPDNDINLSEISSGLSQEGSLDSINLNLSKEESIDQIQST